jgi:hypothetical protein
MTAIHAHAPIPSVHPSLTTQYNYRGSRVPILLEIQLSHYRKGERTELGHPLATSLTTALFPPSDPPQVGG